MIFPFRYLFFFLSLFVFGGFVLAFDTISDTSFEKYVGSGASLRDGDYVPADLEPIDSAFTANVSKKFSLRKEAGIQFADMAWNFWHEFDGDRLVITSAYRSPEFQNSLLKKGCSRKRCALPGASEHQLGLAIDLGVMTKGGKYVAFAKGNRYYTWMNTYAAQRGFHNTYQKGIDIDGQMEEPWHRRYVSLELAQILNNLGLSFAEWRIHYIALN